MKPNVGSILVGMVLGATLLTGVSATSGNQIIPFLDSGQQVYLNGQEIHLSGYTIDGHNYFMIRDIAKALGFNVYWDGAIQIDSSTPYTGVAPMEDGFVVLPSDGSQYIPQTGDVIDCDDGTKYTITDVSRWDKNMFASGPVGALPEPTCDWSQLPQPELPEAEARHIRSNGREYLFVRNLYETRRMLYTLYNAIGDNPETWQDGAPVTHPSGNPKVNISLKIADNLEPQVFWPWRAREITDLFDSCPPGTYSMEAWDIYLDGVFQRTEYRIHVA